MEHHRNATQLAPVARCVQQGFSVNEQEEVRRAAALPHLTQRLHIRLHIQQMALRWDHKEIQKIAAAVGTVVSLGAEPKTVWCIYVISVFGFFSILTD